MRKLDPAYNLTTLANRHGSDKGTVGQDAHSYTRFYEVLLAPRRGQVSRMLEIGLLRGGPEVGGSLDRSTGSVPSIQMWLEYFPDAMVHGFDISDFSFFKHERFAFTRGDSGRVEDLSRLISQGERFDVILDDGSHASYHQQLALATLFPALNPGGLYIIEDLHWQSPFYEETLPKTVTTAQMVRHWFTHGTFPEPTAPELSGLARVPDELSYAFLHTQPFIAEERVKIAVLQKKF